MNALLCGAGHNMRKILKKLRLLCARWGITLRQLLRALDVDVMRLAPTRA